MEEQGAASKGIMFTRISFLGCIASLILRKLSSGCLNEVKENITNKIVAIPNILFFNLTAKKTKTAVRPKSAKK